jgi:YbbR domain-containing protein
MAKLRPGVLILALAIAAFLWGIAHGSSSVERGFDIPVELYGLSDTLVVTDQSVDAVNVRVMGSRAALGNVAQDKFRYSIDVSGGKPGVAVYDVDVSRVELPRGARFVSHSPSRVQVRFEKRGRKAVEVRADIEGEPAAGFHLASVRVQPTKVWLAGARSQVMRLDEVGTETINLAGLKADEVREVSLRLGTGTVWMEEKAPVKVELRIEADLVPELEPEQSLSKEGAGRAAVNVGAGES